MSIPASETFNDVIKSGDKCHGEWDYGERCTIEANSWPEGASSSYNLGRPTISSML